MSKTAIFRGGQPKDSGEPGEAIRAGIAAIGNSGNLLFQTALIDQIKHDVVLGSISDLTDDIDTIILPLANFIRPFGDFSWLYNKLKSSKCERIFIIGAGAQAEFYDKNMKIPPAILNLLSLVSERSASIGVRGYYSAELLARNGIHNVDVIGCPSLFMSRNPRTPHLPDTGVSREGSVVHITPTGHYRDKVAELYKYGCRNDATYILQSEAFIDYALSKDGKASQKSEKHFTFNFAYYLAPNASSAAISEWVKSRGRIFFEFDQWLDFLRSSTRSVGMRFHGNVVAMLANTPALTLTFDTRTREMCEYLQLPHMPLEDFSSDIDPSELAEKCDYTEFRAAYPRKYATYIAYLERNKLEHTLPPALHAAQPEGVVPGQFGFAERISVRALAEMELSLAAQPVTAQRRLERALHILRAFRSEDQRRLSEKTQPPVFRSHGPRLISDI